MKIATWNRRKYSNWFDLLTNAREKFLPRRADNIIQAERSEYVYWNVELMEIYVST